MVLADTIRDNWRRVLLLTTLAAVIMVGLFMVCGRGGNSAAAATDAPAGEVPGPTYTLDEAVGATVEARMAEQETPSSVDVQATLTLEFLETRKVRIETEYEHPWSGGGSGVLNEADYAYVQSIGPAVFPAVQAHLLLEGLLVQLPTSWDDPSHARELTRIGAEIHEAQTRTDRVVGNLEGVSEELRVYGRNLQDGLKHLAEAHLYVNAGVGMVTDAGGWNALTRDQRETLDELYWAGSGELREFQSLLERHGCLACGEVYR